jgi:hypothetical protein
LDNKIGDKKKSQQLQDKHAEIEEYLDQVESDIQTESSGEDIQELLEEAKKVVVLKVVA